MFPTKLESNQVFVFGSNATGFHGAGAAGYAFSGTFANDWRTDARKQAAIKAPEGSLARVGWWCVWGKAVGYQEGIEGQSYAIVTVKKPGLKRSILLDTIRDQVVVLAHFATQMQHLEFLVAPLATGGAGYTEAEVEAAVWSQVVLPPNVRRL